jgi:cell growth-regulating nucleolar protein
MVSFNCDACGDVLTKGKIKTHANRCRIGALSCLDCNTTFRFPSPELDAHTSCVSEAQRYQGKLYKQKNDKRPAKKVKAEPPAASEARAPEPEPTTPAQTTTPAPVDGPLVDVAASTPSIMLSLSFSDLQVWF